MSTESNGKSWLQRLEAKYAWGVLGALTGVVGVVLAVLSMRELRPEVTFTTLSESNVLDVHAALPRLDVLYEGRSIQRTAQNLRIATIRIQNTGDVDILPSFYDPRTPWGVKVSNGKVVEVRMLGASNQYLRSTFRTLLARNDYITFNDVILDRGSWVTVQVLALHRKTENVVLSPTGKIAGIEQFVTTRIRPTEQSNVLDRLFGGSPLTQLARVIVYGVVFAFIAAVALFIFISTRDWSQTRSRRRRRAKIDPLLRTLAIDSKVGRDLRHVYISSGVAGLAEVAEALKDVDNLHAILERKRRRDALLKEYFDKRVEDEDLPYPSEIALDFLDRRGRSMAALAERGVITLEGGQAKIDDSFVSALEVISPLLA